MGIHDVGRLSLGQWIAIGQQWNKAHGKSETQAPTEAEFDAIVGLPS